MYGKFYGIGVGPGDPELLTLKALRVLQKADVLCLPKTGAEKESVAYSIVRQAVDKDFTILELVFPMTREKGELAAAWDEAAEQVARELRQGRNVAFITIGDPSLYSTYLYLSARVREKCPGVEEQIVPGVPSFCAAAAAAGISLAENEETFAVVPAAYGTNSLDFILGHFDNVVLLKVNREYEKVVKKLEENGRLSSSYYISKCGHPDESVTDDLRGLVGRERHYLSMIISKRQKAEEEK